MSFTLETCLETYVSMLTFKRPAFTKSENRFRQRFIHPLGVRYDHFGNAIVRVGNSAVLWSCHTDTVHHKPGRQGVVIEDGIVSLDPVTPSNCLGADCTTGVWLMREMILHEVPGLYIFHAAEETGGHGSSYIATESPRLLAGIKFAIALDRRGKDEVITHQRQVRCASNAFARSLAAQLPGTYRPSPDGLFTDTANYTALIGECCNISVGYNNEHLPCETQDLRHALALRDSLIHFDESTLIFERQPGEDECDSWDSWDNEPEGYADDRLVSFIRREPELVATVLLQYGITLQELKEELCWTRPGSYVDVT